MAMYPGDHTLVGATLRWRGVEAQDSPNIILFSRLPTKKEVLGPLEDP
jgi:hypothetical protein